MGSEVKVDLPESLGDGTKGTMKVELKTENDYVLTNEYGFTIEEERGKFLAFDLIDHPELGTTVLFGNQVFALKFWDTEDLSKGLQIITEAVAREMERRANGGA
jgi:hypothetical protein